MVRKACGNHGRIGRALRLGAAQNHLRDILSLLNKYVVNQSEVCIGDPAKEFDAQRNLTDEKTKGLIGKLLVNLVEWTRRIAPQ